MQTQGEHEILEGPGGGDHSHPMVYIRICATISDHTYRTLALRRGEGCGCKRSSCECLLTSTQ